MYKSGQGLIAAIAPLQPPATTTCKIHARHYQAEITWRVIMLLATGAGFYNNNLATDVDILVAIRFILPL